MPRVLLLVLLALPAGLTAGDCPPEVAKAVLAELKAWSRTNLAPGQQMPAVLNPLRGYAGEHTLLLMRLALRSPHGDLRRQGLDLARLQGEAAAKAVADLAHDPLPALRAEALRVRASLQGTAILGSLRQPLGDEDAQVRRAVIDVLADFGWPAATKERAAYLTTVTRLLDDRDASVRLASIDLLADGPAEVVAPLLARRCCDASPAVALRAVAAVDDPALITERILAAYAHLPPEEQDQAIASLGRLGRAEATPVLLRTAVHRRDRLAAAALAALAQRDLDDRERTAFNQIAPRVLDHPQWWVRSSAAQAFARHGDRRTLGALVRLAAIEGEHQPAALQACRDLSGMPFTDPAKWQAWFAGGGEVAPRPPGPGQHRISFCSIEDVCGQATFVIDISGSMHGDKLGRARDELRQAVLDLDPQATFNVICFSDVVQPWQAGQVPATWANKAACLAFVDGLNAQGGTATELAVATALADPGGETVFLLTDGLPTSGETDPDRLIALLSTRNRERRQPLRLHTIAFGIEEAEPLLSRLAAGNGGRYQLVP